MRTIADILADSEKRSSVIKLYLDDLAEYYIAKIDVDFMHRVGYKGLVKDHLVEVSEIRYLSAIKKLRTSLNATRDGGYTCANPFCDSGIKLPNRGFCSTVCFTEYYINFPNE